MYGGTPVLIHVEARSQYQVTSFISLYIVYRVRVSYSSPGLSSSASLTSRHVSRAPSSAFPLMALQVESHTCPALTGLLGSDLQSSHLYMAGALST